MSIDLKKGCYDASVMVLLVLTLSATTTYAKSHHHKDSAEGGVIGLAAGVGAVVTGATVLSGEGAKHPQMRDVYEAMNLGEDIR